MTHPVRTGGEAESALAYFNAFHDGFRLELTLRSGARFQVVRKVPEDFPLGDGEWSIDRVVIEGRDATAEARRPVW